jgi:hypothetical protein
MEDRGKSNNAPWWDVGGVVQEVCVVVVEEEEEGGRGKGKDDPGVLECE